MTSKRRHRPLTEEDVVLWRKVGRTVTPLDRARGKMLEDLGKVLEEQTPPPDGQKPDKRKRNREGEIRSPFPDHRIPPAPKTARIGERPIDRPTTRKIAKGRITIDGRIDLHDMTQDQAYDRLYAFLASSRSHGDRHVLVVTGKGRSLGSEGVLKRMVPIWLKSARFSDLVSGYSQASHQHGGEGAIYIRLRKLAKADGSMRP
jgi:DNA-nicking Smr family endonuclease